VDRIFPTRCLHVAAQLRCFDRDDWAEREPVESRRARGHVGLAE